MIKLKNILAEAITDKGVATIDKGTTINLKDLNGAAFDTGKINYTVTLPENFEDLDDSVSNPGNKELVFWVRSNRHGMIGCKWLSKTPKILYCIWETMPEFKEYDERNQFSKGFEQLIAGKTIWGYVKARGLRSDTLTTQLIKRYWSAYNPDKNKPKPIENPNATFAKGDTGTTPNQA